MKWVLIRHGKTRGNLEYRYIGSRTDESLCPQGIAELKQKQCPAVVRGFVSPIYFYYHAKAMQNVIKYGERGDKTSYNESMSVSGGSFYLGAGYRFTENFIAGLEAGFQLQDNDNSIPLYLSMKYYYGKAVQKKRYRWFNYLNAGPQFYIGSSSKTVGGLLAAGGGLRVLAGRTMKMDFYMGYQLNMRNCMPSDTGKVDYPASDVKYRQFAHLIQVGVNIPLW